MGTLYSIARALGDGALALFTWLPPLLGLVALSVACGLVFLLAFRLVSPQRRLLRVKELMSSTIYEMRLFSSAPRRVLAAQGRALFWGLCYLGLALPAFALLFPPMGALMVRAATWYEYRPLRVGEVALITLSLDKPHTQDKPLGTLVQARAESDGITILSPQVATAFRSQVFLRVRAQKPGVHYAWFKVGHQVLSKRVSVALKRTLKGPVSLVATRRDEFGFLLSHEPPLPSAGDVNSVEVEYPRDTRTWLGMPWYLLLVLVSLVAALLLRRRLRVVF